MYGEPLNTAAYVHAGKTNIPIELEALAYHSCPFVRVRVASNCHTRLSALQKLAEDQEIAVRASVADNPSTPRKLIRKMAAEVAYRDRLDDKNDKFHNWSVLRRALAGNRYTQIKILRVLYATGDWCVYVELTNNPSCRKDLLKAMLRLPCVWYVHEGKKRDRYLEIKVRARKRLGLPPIDENGESVVEPC